MKKLLELEPARALPVVLALMLIYALSSVSAARSFADLKPPVPGSATAGASLTNVP